MVDEELKQQVNVPEKVDDSVLSSEQLMQKIEDVKTIGDIKDLTDLFNANIAKNEMLRALKQDELLNVVLKQAADRLEKRPDELSTKDLIDYMNVFQNNLERVSGVVDRATTRPTIQINQHKDVVINVGDVSRENRENVIEYIKEFLKSSNKDDIIDMTSSNQTIAKGDEDD